MKRKILTAVVILLLAVGTVLLPACNNDPPPPPEPDKYTVTFMSDGYIHATLETAGNEILSFPDNPKNIGYAFMGWYLDDGVYEQLFTKWDYENVAVTDNITVYAMWRIKSDGLFFWLNGAKDAYSVSGLYIDDAEVEIPGVYEGLPVTMIRGFRDHTNLTSIIMPDSIEVIGWDAFYGCTNLTSIIIPDSVTEIGRSAFEGCIGLTGVTIPDGVTVIERYAFRGCIGLKNITIPDSVTVMDDYAFEGCIGLTNVKLSEKLSTLNSVFENCTGLTGIVIPPNVKLVAPSAFRNCTSLADITISDSIQLIYGSAFRNTAYWNNSATDLVYMKGWVLGQKHAKTVVEIAPGTKGIAPGAFASCTDLRSVTIPDSVTYIGTSAFSYCTSLTDITIPDSVTTIKIDAFYRCLSLSNINIPNNITNIENYVFAYCNSLTDITIPDSVTQIYGLAFFRCKGLTDVVIPKSVKSISCASFVECEILSNIFYAGTADDWDSIDFYKDYNLDMTHSRSVEVENATKYFYSETQPTEEGNYWRYVDDKPTPWE